MARRRKISPAKEAYLELLKRPEWIEKAKEIRKRDSYTCRRCHRNGMPMDVHHCVHTDGLMPWEEPDSSMITVCRGCHNYLHGDGPDPIPPEPLGKRVSSEEAKLLFALIREEIR